MHLVVGGGCVSDVTMEIDIMNFEIDQSGKIEKTGKHTYLALSNHKKIIVKLPAREKQELQKIFRRMGKRRLFVYATFAIIFIIAVRKMRLANNTFVIDREYPGKDELIKDLISNYYPKISRRQILIRPIGKKSKAHFLAYGAALKKIKPDIIVTKDEILKIIKKPGNA